MKNSRTRRPAAAVATALLLIAGHGTATNALAQTYPTKPVRLVVAFPAGGGIDSVTRLLSPKLSDALGQQMIIDNRVGASGNIGTDFVAKSAPDGYTVLMAYASHASNAALFDKLPYDTVKDFHGVSLIGAVPHIILVNPSMPVKTVPDLIRLAKARPGEINYSTPGNGTPLHLATELLKVITGINLTHVPYKGAQPAMVATISGETQMTITTMVVSTPLMKAGRLRGIAVLNPKRVASFPELPTVAESGVKGTESNSWYGMLVSASTPRPIVDRLHAAMVKALAAADIKQKFAEQSVEISGSTPEQFDAFVRSEIEKWSKVVKASGAHPD
ncbi:MAG TPA: tripartite tricarboxylate transporter substrate binding protein [Burkholderiales bacterium]|nr:tripartite tricarboxylate transporter substrate binding protein [Burkholderiales bacterium]